MTTVKNECKLCLKTTTEFSPLDASNTEKLQQIVPDLKLTPETNSVICNECKQKLDESHKLKRTCSSSNKLICFLRNYLQVNQPMELKELLKGNKKDDKLSKSNYVCRICLKGNDGDYTNFTDAKTSEYGEVLKTCLSDEDEKLTLDPKLCKLCIGLLRGMHSFLQQLTVVENKIKLFTVNENFDSFKIKEIKKEKEEKCEVKNTEEVSEKKSVEVNETHKNDENESKNDGELASVTDQNDDLLYSDVPHYNFKPTLLHAPQLKKYRIQDWMRRVESYKTRHNLSDATVKQKIIRMMSPLPHIQSWFSSIADVTTWDEFKNKVSYAFPDVDDYHFKVSAMVNRLKKPTETYAKYYTAKISLLESLDLPEDKVISTLLGGVGDDLVSCIGRMGRYETREQVLAYFKSCDDKEKIKNSMSEDGEEAKKVKKVWVKNEEKAKNNGTAEQIPSKIETPKPKPKKKPNTRQNANIVLVQDEQSEKNTKVAPQSEKVSVQSEKVSVQEKMSVSNGTASNSGPRCACCDKSGHSSMDCPLLRNKSVPAPPKTKDVVGKNANRVEKCSFCDSTGHSTQVCPLIYNKTPEPRPSKIKIVLDKDKLDKKPRPSQTVRENDDLVCETSPKKCKTGPSRWQAEPSVPHGLQTCASCNNVGHSSVNCPFVSTTGCDMSEPIESVLQPETYALKKLSNRKCLCCNETGHSSLDCPLLNMHLTGQNKTETEKYEPQYVPVQPTCPCCNKTGHSAPNCPFFSFFQQGVRDREGEPPQKKPREEQEKCYFCDKKGHSSVDCFRATLEQERSKIQGTSQETSYNQSKDYSKAPKCDFCKKIGHKMADCYHAKSDRKFYESHGGPKKSHSNKQCLICGKFGHIQYNCPKNKGGGPKNVQTSWFKGSKR